MNIVRKIKIKIVENTSKKKFMSLPEEERKLIIKDYYKFIRDAQYQQYKALNKAMSYLVSAYYENNSDIKSEGFVSKRNALTNSNPIFKDISFGEGIDTASAVTQKVKKDFTTALKNGFANGDRSVTNYKRTNPLITRGRDLKFSYKNEKEDTVVINWVHGIMFECVLGWKKNSLELKHTLHKVINGEYKVNGSSIEFNKKNDMILNLNITIPEKKVAVIKGRTLGVDMGLANPIYMSVSDDFTLKASKGSYEEFAKVRMQFKERRRRLQSQLTLAKGGKGRKNKLSALNKLKSKESKFAQTYNHTLSRAVVDFAVKNQCEFINLEKINGDTLNNRILGNWGYYQLQEQIVYKAKLVGIEVRFIDCAYTSQTCNACGHVDKLNRTSQSKFKCTKCGIELNADWNASINISRSTNFVTNKKKSKKKDKEIKFEELMTFTITNTSNKKLAKSKKIS